MEKEKLDRINFLARKAKESELSGEENHQGIVAIIPVQKYSTVSEIIEAARLSHSYSFIKRLPEGLDTYIGEDGGSLSQGQKQLLCITRVMLTNPQILILDEATSSIDTRTEIRVQKAFRTLLQGKTSFVVAHRLSTILGADTILYMEKGRILEMGTHTELLEKNGRYAKLFRSQFEA